MIGIDRLGTGTAFSGAIVLRFDLTCSKTFLTLPTGRLRARQVRCAFCEDLRSPFRARERWHVLGG